MKPNLSHLGLNWKEIRIGIAGKLQEKYKFSKDHLTEQVTDIGDDAVQSLRSPTDDGAWGKRIWKVAISGKSDRKTR